ncbi:DNA-binding transcriptional regulator, LysR family [Marininema mesophilum]|uniref:DNA-binding transcriptional regulator, LysR family n=1 Tax=Marininema mesophilum TaxID=1048340 RepID=A0A1H2WJC4_9BACL|nr:LysR family transcriptional regulator [Marininema mesophilum]SDW80608.1 DNA-binding transcriptional regulator, LysR family [Marininema mesophilum]
MDIRDLQIFQTVSRHKSVTKAANELNYVQSNVTNRINRLEQELNAQLFHRSGKGMSLTSAGRNLIQYADPILEMVNEAKNAFLIPQGPLKLGSTESTAAVHLPSLLMKYHEAYPQVDVSLTTASSEELIKRVLHYELDGVFVVGPINHPELKAFTFMEEELVLISSPHHPPIHSARDLQHETLLVFDVGCSYRSRLEQWLSDEKAHSVKRMELSTLEGLFRCVESGFGVALVTRSVAQEYKRGEIKLHPLSTDYHQSTTVFIQRKDRYQSPALSRLVELMENE